jgi:tetratricopeptide (TPR) repeat protein
MATTYQNAVSVFLSYAHEDEPLLRQLETHLSGLQRQGLISTWHDRKIVPGRPWAEEIDEHLEQASVILLLVSADFLASDYCYQVEMKRALERHQAGEARVIPIILRPADWKHTPLADLQALPTDARAITTWKNRDLAWVDVATGIRRAIEDLPLLAASASRAKLPAIWNIPYPRNPFFTGRDALLAQLHTQLRTGQTTALSQSPHALSGLGGIGKTQLAIEYAYRYHQDYAAVLWARAESEEALNTSYTAIATLLKLPERDAEQEVIIQAVKLWLHTHRHWLLILDNADDLSLLPPFLPLLASGHILLTTRVWDMQRLATRLEVETLADERGVMLLLHRAGRLAAGVALEQAMPEERQWAARLVQELGGLPLALDQAGAYLEATGMSLQEYYHIYQKHRRTLLSERRSRIPDHPDAVATTWSLSFQRVEEKSSAATELLRCCAYLAPDVIPEELLVQGAKHLGPLLAPVAADALLFSQAIEALRTYSLVGRDPQTRALTLHRLVQAVVRDGMSAQAARHWKKRVVLAIYAACPDVTDIEAWDACERWLPHALTCALWIEQAQISSPEAAYLLNAAGYYLHERGRYREAEPLHQRALAIYERQLGPEHPLTAQSLNNLALLYRLQGKYEQAEPLFQRALAIREQQSGPEHPDTAHSLNNLAALYRAQGKYEQAEPLHQRALSIRERQLGPDHPDTAQSLNSLAMLYDNQGKYEQAEPLYQRALAIREQQLGPEHPDTAHSLNNLAVLYRAQGKYEQAEPLHQRALAIWEQRVGPEHPDTATTLRELASLYQAQGKYEQAEPLFQRALHIYEQQLGLAHPRAAHSFNNLAELYVHQGKYEQAEPLFQRALAIREQRLGPEHPETATSLNDLATLYRAQGKYEQAEPLYQHAFAIREQQLGPEHPDTASSLNNLALLYRAQGKYEQAEPLYQRALAIRERQLGPEHPDTAQSLNDLAMLYYQQGKYEQAELLYQRTLAIYEQQLGPEHPHTNSAGEL